MKVKKMNLKITSAVTFVVSVMLATGLHAESDMGIAWRTLKADVKGDVIVVMEAKNPRGACHTEADVEKYLWSLQPSDASYSEVRRRLRAVAGGSRVASSDLGALLARRCK